MGRKSKLKKQRKAAAKESDISLPKPKGDIERLNQLGYGKHNQLRSPEVPFDRPEPKL